ncbi:MAG: ABC transporter substrate-binding protein [Cellulomonas sp.]
MSTARRGRFTAVALATAVLAATVGCSSSTSEGGSTAAATDAGEPSGSILVLTNRTDVVDTLFKDYAKTFEAKYPKVTVTFQALADYAGDVKTRMNTKDYGDVLLIPTNIAGSDLSSFFEPLGSVADLSKTYRFTGAQAYEGQVYGLATFGDANGYVYNKKIFSEAGITDLPKTPEEFVADLQKVKDKTSAVPLYSNYKDGWPLEWTQGWMGVQSGDKDALVKMSTTAEPWATGQEKRALDDLSYQIASKGLIEADPTTTNWESSKNLIATGKIGVMVLGSWAIPQMQDAATKAGTDPADIGFAPAPFQVDGAFQSPVGADWTMGINVNSKSKAADRAWVDWFINDSGYYDVNGAVSTKIGQPPAKALQTFEASGVKYMEMTPAPKLTDVDNQAQIGLSQPDYYRTLIDSARGASKQTEQQIFDQLNQKWSEALKTVG